LTEIRIIRGETNWATSQLTGRPLNWRQTKRSRAERTRPSMKLKRNRIGGGADGCRKWQIPIQRNWGRNQYLLEGRGRMWNRRAVRRAGEEPAEWKGDLALASSIRIRRRRRRGRGRGTRGVDGWIPSERVATRVGLLGVDEIEADFPFSYSLSPLSGNEILYSWAERLDSAVAGYLSVQWHPTVSGIVRCPTLLAGLRPNISTAPLHVEARRR
jgi:hypothetical protein